MKTFESMTDEEINHAVHEIVIGHKLEPFGRSSYIYEGDYEDGKQPTLTDKQDYCNDPSVAWPIMQENYIETSYDGISWSARSYFNNVGWYCDWRNNAERPLRLAMIVFLMIKGFNGAQTTQKEED